MGSLLAATASSIAVKAPAFVAKAPSFAARSSSLAATASAFAATRPVPASVAKVSVSAAALPIRPVTDDGEPGASAAEACRRFALRRQGALRRHVQRTGAALLNQQCWLWGCDIRQGAGNLLLQHGFERQPAPAGQERSTQYTLRLPAERVVRLWGSGVYFGTVREGIFLNRFLFEPRHAAYAEVWQDPAVLREGPRHWQHGWLAELAAWVAGYELCIAKQEGAVYRRTCLAAFAGSVSHDGRIAAEWAELAACLRS